VCAENAILVRNALAEQMTPEQIAEADRIAATWRPRERPFEKSLWAGSAGGVFENRSAADYSAVSTGSAENAGGRRTRLLKRSLRPSYRAR
jgi:hypothetical protein